MAVIEVVAAVNLLMAGLGFFLRPPLADTDMLLDQLAVVTHSDQLANGHVRAVG